MELENEKNEYGLLPKHQLGNIYNDAFLMNLKWMRLFSERNLNNCHGGLTSKTDRDMYFEDWNVVHGPINKAIEDICRHCSLEDSVKYLTILKWYIFNLSDEEIQNLLIDRLHFMTQIDDTCKELLKNIA